MAPPQGSDKLEEYAGYLHIKKAPMTGIHLSILPILNQDAYLKSCSKMRLLPHACLFCSGHCEARKSQRKTRRAGPVDPQGIVYGKTPFTVMIVDRKIELTPYRHLNLTLCGL